MENLVCGANTRNGTPCKKKPLNNGRCRLHGGKSTGPKNREMKSKQMAGNKNALKTGEYETISFDTLSEEEQDLLRLVPEDPEKLLRGSIRVLEVRKRRILQRYSIEQGKANPSDKKLNGLDEALTRLSARETEHYRLLHDLSDGTTDNDIGALGALVDILADVRSERKR